MQGESCLFPAMEWGAHIPAATDEPWVLHAGPRKHGLLTHVCPQGPWLSP